MDERRVSRRLAMTVTALSARIALGDPQCTGKRRFPNRGAALLNLSRRGGDRRVHTKCSRNLHPYECRACGSWHIGSE